MKRAALRLLLTAAAVLAAAAPAAAQAGEDSTPGNGKKVDHVALLRQAIADPTKVVIAQTAPAVRVALGEMFGMVGALLCGRPCQLLPGWELHAATACITTGSVLVPVLSSAASPPAFPLPTHRWPAGHL
jgi:hypothetical protein